MSANSVKPVPAKPGAPSSARRAIAPGAAKPQSKLARNVIIAGVLALLVIVPLSVWAYFHFRGSSRSQKVEQLMAKARESRDNKNLTDDQRRQAFEEVKTAMDSLSESERQAIFAKRMEEGMRSEAERMDKFMAMSAAERAAYVRKEAADDAKRFDDRAARDKQGGNAGSNPGGSGPPGPGGNSSGSGQPGGGGPPGGWKPPTAEQRSQMRKWMLDHTTPLQRAQFGMYLQQKTQAIGDQNAIRSAQGLPALPPPNPWGGFRR